MTTVLSSHSVSDLAGPSTRAVSVKPVVLDAPKRGEDLQVRVSAPGRPMRTRTARRPRAC